MRRLIDRMLLLVALLAFMLVAGVLITAIFFDDLPCSTDTDCNCIDCLETSTETRT